jgi:hypothetical protein
VIARTRPNRAAGSLELAQTAEDGDQCLLRRRRDLDLDEIDAETAARCVSRR